MIKLRCDVYKKENKRFFANIKKIVSKEPSLQSFNFVKFVNFITAKEIVVLTGSLLYAYQPRQSSFVTSLSIIFGKTS